jgi:hypothetical protein
LRWCAQVIACIVSLKSESATWGGERQERHLAFSLRAQEIPGDRGKAAKNATSPLPGRVTIQIDT